MKFRPKFILGLITLLTLISLASFIFSRWVNKKDSLVILSTVDNRFKVDFQIQKKDQESFSKILEGLAIPQNIQDGLEFELDATHSATLAFFTPIEVNLNILKNSADFSGEFANVPQIKEFKVQSLKVPTSTNLVIFAPDFRGFLNSRLQIPLGFMEWLEKNLSSQEGQYLIVFGQDSNFAIISKLVSTDLEGLKDIQIDNSKEPFYKEEAQEEATFHLLKFSRLPDNEEQTVALVQLDQWLYLVSSREAAQELLEVYNAKRETIEFDLKAAQGTAAFALLYRSSNDHKTGENFTSLIISDISYLDFNKARFTDHLARIGKFQLILKANILSGLIEVK